MASCLSPHLTTSVHLPSICLIPVFLHVITLPALQRAARYLPICPYLAPSTFLSAIYPSSSAVSGACQGGVSIRVVRSQPLLQRTYICTLVYMYPRRRIASCCLVFVLGPTRLHSSSIIHHPLPRSSFARSPSVSLTLLTPSLLFVPSACWSGRWICTTSAPPPNSHPLFLCLVRLGSVLVVVVHFSVFGVEVVVVVVWSPSCLPLRISQSRTRTLTSLAVLRYRTSRALNQYAVVAVVLS